MSTAALSKKSETFGFPADYTPWKRFRCSHSSLLTMEVKAAPDRPNAMKRLILFLFVAALIVAPAASADVVVNGRVLSKTPESFSPPQQEARDIQVNVRAGTDGEFVVVEEDRDGEEKKVMIVDRSGAFLGIYFDELDRKTRREMDYPKKTGVLITGLVEDGPAGEAGIEPGDIIWSFGGETVEDGGHLVEMLADSEPGDEVEIVLYRDGKKKEIELELGEHERTVHTWSSKDMKRKYAELAPRFERPAESYRLMMRGAGPRIGVKLYGLSDPLAGYFDVEKGALVLEVAEDGPAEEAGIEPGDVIVRAGEKEIESPGDLVEYLAEFDEDDDVELTIVRKGGKKTIEVTVDGDLDADWHVYGFGGGKGDERFVWRMPRIEKVEIPHIRMERVELEKELEQLREQMKRLQERLEKLER